MPILIGTRELSLADGGVVLISFYMPTREGEHEYHCGFQISGLAKEIRSRAIGGDALQAVQLALLKVGSFLYTSDEWNRKLLSWNGERELGFPIPDAIKDMLSPKSIN